MCLATSNNLFLVLQDAPKHISFHKLTIFWSAKKRHKDTFFFHPPSPFPGNFCNCNSGGICTALQFQVQLPLLYTVEVEPRIAKQYKCQYCCCCKDYRGKGMEGGKKRCLCVVFWLTRRSRVRRKNAFWGILQHEQQVIAYCQTHYDYGPPKMPLKLAV